MTLKLSASVEARGAAFDLRVDAGETVAVLGPNGSGKSTLLGVIAGLLEPDSGRATLDGRLLFEFGDARGGARRARRAWLPPHDREVSLLSQDALLFPHLSVRENVAFGPRSRGVPRREADRRADEWLERVDAGGLADRRPHQLSGGQSQRVAIARALAVDPKLLLLDEPMAALDVGAVPAMRRLLRDVVAERMTVFVTHDVLDALVLADRVVLLDGGRIVDAGATRDVFAFPSTPFVARLAGVNLLTGAWHGGALRTDAGQCIRATPSRPIADGADANVAIRPSRIAVSDARDGLSDSAGADSSTSLVVVVTDLEPHDDTVRVRAGDLAADASPSEVADLDLAPGSRVRFTFDAADATAYPR